MITADTANSASATPHRWPPRTPLNLHSLHHIDGFTARTTKSAFTPTPFVGHRESLSSIPHIAGHRTGNGEFAFATPHPWSRRAPLNLHSLPPSLATAATPPLNLHSLPPSLATVKVFPPYPTSLAIAQETGNLHSLPHIHGHGGHH